MVQRFSYIGAADGRLVPCAYSLGNFLTTMSELSGNRDSAILRVELTRGADGISAKYSYIPCMTEDRDWGAEIVPVSPPHSAGEPVLPYSAPKRSSASGSTAMHTARRCS